MASQMIAEKRLLPIKISRKTKGHCDFKKLQSSTVYKSVTNQNIASHAHYWETIRGNTALRTTRHCCSFQRAFCRRISL